MHNFLDGDYYQSDWGKSGVLEADCLICHLKGYNWKARVLAVRGGFFYEAPMVGAGWFTNLKKSKPSIPSEKPKALLFHTNYTQTNIADAANLAEFITKEVIDENCWNCHVMADVKKRGRTWKRKTDVNKAKGLNCIYCQPEEKGWISIALRGQLYPNLGTLALLEKLGNSMDEQNQFE